MNTSFSRFLLTCMLTALCVIGSPALAQTEWSESGSVIATIGGVHQTTHAYDMRSVDADGVTEAPGATYMFNEEFKMGTMVLAPASYLVTTLTFDMELPNTMVGSIELSFYLDPVLVLDDATWRISGAITGQVSLQTESEPEHNPDDYFDIDATFEFQRVVDYASMLGGQ